MKDVPGYVILIGAAFISLAILGVLKLAEHSRGTTNVAAVAIPRSTTPESAAGLIDHEYLKKIAEANAKEAEKLRLSMVLKPKDDYCIAWRPILIGLPIAPAHDDETVFLELQHEAENGDAWAQAQLGSRYFTGVGTHKNLAEAKKWLQLAANKEQPLAQAYLGDIYAGGEGMGQDWMEAYFFLSLASIQGAKSEQHCRDAETHLSPNQIVSTKKRVIERLQSDKLLPSK